MCVHVCMCVTRMCVYVCANNCRYAAYIRSSPDMAQLWDEVMLLLVSNTQ